MNGSCSKLATLVFLLLQEAAHCYMQKKKRGNNIRYIIKKDTGRTQQGENGRKVIYNRHSDVKF